ncbi:MAG: GtrA family protein [Alphaproteobacteria bacterium]
MRTRVSRLLTSPNGPVSRKAVSFALIGVVNTLVDFAVFSIAWGLVELSPLLSNLLAWFIAASGSYLMNCLITFAEESGGKIGLRTYLGFLASGVAGLIAGTAVLLIAATLAPVLLAKLVAMVASFALNFLLSHFLIFPPRETRH